VVVIKKLIIVLAFVFIVSLFSVSAQDYLALQGSVTGATTGNVVVEIWSAPTGGTLLYNSSNDFNNVISSSRYDILVGNGTQPLSLNFSGTYYMNLNIAGKDMDFNGSDRQVFQSPVGNITTSRPIKTYSTSASALNVNDKLNISGLDGNVTTGGNVLITSTDTDDALNVSAGGANIFGNTVISGKATLQSTDADDALNVSLGGLTVAGGSPGNMPFKVANNGAVQIRNNDADDALNVSAGGSYFAGNTVFNNNLAVNGGVFSSNVPGRFTSNDNDDALNVTAGGANIFGNTVISGKATLQSTDADDALNVSLGGLTVAGGSPGDMPFKVANNGAVQIRNNDADDALNVSAGGSYFAGNTVFNNNLAVNGGVFSSNVPGRFTSNDNDDALNVTAGGANIFGNTVISGKATLQSTDADDALNVSLGGLVVAGGSPGDMPFKVANNGAVQIKNDDPDYALNVTGGSYFWGGATISGRLIGNDANKDFSWDGKVSFTNNDADDALNISNGGMYVSSGPDYFYFNPGAAPPSAIFSIKRIFNVSTFGDVTSSGTVTILSTDPDDALNVTGAVRFGGNPMYADRFTVDGNGNVNIRSSARNALNVSSGGAFIQGNTSIWGDTVVVGNPNPPGTNMQNHITIRDGKGPDKCAYLELYDEGGQPWAIWINTTGDMRISNNPPANCSISGEGVGSQP